MGNTELGSKSTAYVVILFFLFKGLSFTASHDRELAPNAKNANATKTRG